MTETNKTETPSPGSLQPAGSAPDPRIAWHMKRNPKLSRLSIDLAIVAIERGDDDHSYQWEEANARRFQGVLDHSAPNDQAHLSAPGGRVERNQKEQ